jgi:hypothetical protein
MGTQLTPSNFFRTAAKQFLSLADTTVALVLRKRRIQLGVVFFIAVISGAVSFSMNNDAHRACGSIAATSKDAVAATIATRNGEFP